MFGPTPATGAFIEASGSARVLTDILERGPVGGRLSVVALHYEPIPTSYLMLLMKQFTIRGRWSTPTASPTPWTCWPGPTCPSIVTDRVPLERFDEALATLEGSKECGKVLVTHGPYDVTRTRHPGRGTGWLMSGPLDLDLSDPTLLRADVLDDPRPFHDRLRADAPVWKVPGQDSYLVSDPKLVREAVGRPEDFSSNLVSLLHDDGQGRPVPFQLSGSADAIHVLATADPPLHTRHRRLLQTHLSPAAVAALEPTIEAIVDEQLTRPAAQHSRGRGPTFSDPVPARTICELIGLPPTDMSRIVQLVGDTGALLDGVTDLEGMSRAAHAALELTMYVEQQLHIALELESEQRKGLLGIFAAAVEGGEVDAGEVRDMLVVLVSAGSETTASLLSTIIETLARDPELQERLRTTPSDIPDELERILRADGPFQFHYRWTPEDTELRWLRIPARSRVLLMWAAANRPSATGRKRGAADGPDRGRLPTSPSDEDCTSASAHRSLDSRHGSPSSGSSLGPRRSSWTPIVPPCDDPASSSAATRACPW